MSPPHHFADPPHRLCLSEPRARRSGEDALVTSDEEYVLTKDFEGEHERLLLLEAHVDPLSVVAIEAAGIKPGSRCLEIGAGAGSIARWLHQTFRDAMRAWVDVIGRTGTDYEWTRRFPEPLQRHGYREVGAAAIAPILQGSTPIARFWSLTLETLRPRIVEAALVSDAVLDDARRLRADPEFWDFGAGWVAAWGKRPA